LQKRLAAINPQLRESALKADFCWVLAISAGYGGKVVDCSCRG
jgi:hypothetical protein